MAATDTATLQGQIQNALQSDPTLHNDNITIMPNMLEPNNLINVDHRKVESTEVSRVSLMPGSSETSAYF